MKNGFSQSFIWSLILCMQFLHSCGSKGQVMTSQQGSSPSQKITGLSFVASSQVINEKEFEFVKSVNPSHLAVMPYGFMRKAGGGELVFDHKNQWWGERSGGVQETIKLSHKRGFKIMLKPQIWIGDGTFTGFLEMNTEALWLQFEAKYRDFILKFAKIAQDEDVELYCIGTELGRFVNARPAFWDQLITDVKSIYKGKLTYAENWDCYEKPGFLSRLDYVGVDAYFPLSEKQNPSKKEIKEGWAKHLLKMKTCADSLGKPILFTECGYRSMDFAASKPWDYSRGSKVVNLDLQAKLLEVMFEEVWSKDYVAGGFIWKWFPMHEEVGGTDNDQFTPQNKPAEKVISKAFRDLSAR
jgi:hypothetical protein